MIADIHTHILPHMDDGADSTETALEMLRQSYLQGVDTVIATPHYYSDMPVEEFTERRLTARDSLGELGEGYPEIRLWAETYYTPSLRYMDLEGLSYKGTILLELPFEAVSKTTLKDIEYIKSSLGYDIIIAHIERYEKYDALFDLGVGIQVNAESVSDPRVKKLIKKGKVDFVASDMHNLKKRPPNLSQALEKVSRIYGDECGYIKENARRFASV